MMLVYSLNEWGSSRPVPGEVWAEMLLPTRPPLSTNYESVTRTLSLIAHPDPIFHRFTHTLLQKVLTNKKNSYSRMFFIKSLLLSFLFIFLAIKSILIISHGLKRKINDY